MGILKIVLGAALCASTLMAADARQVLDKTLTNAEKEFVSLVAAMPADKFNFAPTGGKFDGVRTFGQQAKHVAFVLDQISSTLLGEKNPSASGANENGPDNLTTKEQILQYVKDAFAYAHKAVAKLTDANLLQETVNPFDAKGRSPRLESANELIWHTFDHYGQMVVYARMNGIVPPASQ